MEYGKWTIPLTDCRLDDVSAPLVGDRTWQRPCSTSKHSRMTVALLQRVDDHSGPEVAEAEGDRIERADAHWFIVLRAPDQHPLALAELERRCGRRRPQLTQRANRARADTPVRRENPVDE